jgi:hypothetical protein
MLKVLIHQQSRAGADPATRQRPAYARHSTAPSTAISTTPNRDSANRGYRRRREGGACAGGWTPWRVSAPCPRSLQGCQESSGAPVVAVHSDVPPVEPGRRLVAESHADQYPGTSPLACRVGAEGCMVLGIECHGPASAPPLRSHQEATRAVPRRVCALWLTSDGRYQFNQMNVTVGPIHHHYGQSRSRVGSLAIHSASLSSPLRDDVPAAPWPYTQA